jgi:hypothetical protein
MTKKSHPLLCLLKKNYTKNKVLLAELPTQKNKNFLIGAK